MEEDRFKVQQLSKKYLDQSIDFLADMYLHHDPICQALDFKNHLEAKEEFFQLLIAIAEEGLSVIAIDTQTEKIEAVLLNEISMRNTETGAFLEPLLDNLLDSCKQFQSRQFVRYCLEIRKVLKRYIDPAVKVIGQTTFGCITPDLRGTPLMAKLVDFSVHLGERLREGVNAKVSVRDDIKFGLGPTPEMLISICSADEARNMSIDKFGFELIKEIDLRDLEFEGKKWLNRAFRGKSPIESLIGRRII